MIKIEAWHSLVAAVLAVAIAGYSMWQIVNVTNVLNKIVQKGGVLNNHADILNNHFQAFYMIEDRLKTVEKQLGIKQKYEVSYIQTNEIKKKN